VKKPVSKFAFQVHNLQRYSEAAVAADRSGAPPPTAAMAQLATGPGAKMGGVVWRFA
jgi:hypothetical protein